MNTLLAVLAVGWSEALVGIALILAVALVASFWPASRGHWSAPILAGPGLLGGLAVLPVFLGPHIDFPLKVAGCLPLALASVSLLLWSKRRHARKRKPDPDPPSDPLP